ncbi:CYTH domain-containing protein [Flexivirga alba]|uniref:CYTH domain-containing protein n=1 Tax=Flexivirga alba TaxID=702742 RepID=A0ABW2ADS2_9MICO
MADVARHLEVERKFTLADREAPDPASWPGVTSVSEPVRHELDALYYDTGDVRLAGAGVTLRRRVGGADDGWHLKVPGESEGRFEHGLPLGEASDGPPEEFVAQVAHLTGESRCSRSAGCGRPGWSGWSTDRRGRWRACVTTA